MGHAREARADGKNRYRSTRKSGHSNAQTPHGQPRLSGRCWQQHSVLRREMACAASILRPIPAHESALLEAVESARCRSAPGRCQRRAGANRDGRQQVFPTTPWQAQAVVMFVRPVLSQGSPPAPPTTPRAFAPQISVCPLRKARLNALIENNRLACWEGDTVSPLSG